MVSDAVSDPAGYATSFGYSGTYWDYVQMVAREREGLTGLLDLSVTESDVKAILTESGFTGYRFCGALEWILKTLDMVRSLLDIR
jgi:hypothetical protein